jgi:hypothetical protein
MKILLVFDDKFPVDSKALLQLLNQLSKSIQFQLYKPKLKLPAGLLTKPETFSFVQVQMKTARKTPAHILVFTEGQYVDRFFFHGDGVRTIFSLYSWNYLTDLPITNGVLYFIIDYLALQLDPSDYRHYDVTGCIYDFLGDKTGVDDGMRQARFCSNCLKRLSEILTHEVELNAFEDLKVLMNHLSNASRWNQDVLASPKKAPTTIGKRKPKNRDGVHVVIASPGDTQSERQMLLDYLEVKFRRDGHEGHCRFRIIVNGWEDLASQGGYPQDVINERIIERSDFVVAIFKHKLGTPTKDSVTGSRRSGSGTAEELLQALDKSNPDHPIGMAYFFSKAPVISLDSPDKKNIEEEWDRLAQFKDSIKERMIFKPYTEAHELMSTVLKDLEKNIQDYVG